MDKVVLSLRGQRVADARRYTAQMAFCVARLSVLFLLAGVATSCSEVFIVELFNNTGSPVVIIVSGGFGEKETIGVAPGRSAKIRESSLQGATVSFEGTDRNLEFDVFRPGLPPEYTSAQPPFFRGDRRVRFQLNSDGTIWAVRPKTRMPISASEQQPDGFPVALKAT